MSGKSILSIVQYFLFKHLQCVRFKVSSSVASTCTFFYFRSDGSFSVNGLPSGTYVVEVINPTYIFEASRVDITTKGRYRARRVNYLQPSLVKTMHYPLEFRERRKASYFQQREQWKITDFLMNPMVSRATVKK